MSLLSNITEYYTYVNNDLADPRTNKFMLVSSPLPIMIIMFIYHRFVHTWGPAFMANRPPYKLKNLIIIYNIAQIYLSAFMAVQCITYLYLPGYYSLWCQKINYDDTPVERLIIERVWLYYFIKIIDLLDTVFFVLRKKFNQVSFLHVYHHLGMCLLGYIGTKYVPGPRFESRHVPMLFSIFLLTCVHLSEVLTMKDLRAGFDDDTLSGHGIMLGFINSMVHAVMYTYYLISIVRPKWVKQWWKKYITQLQILQFLLLILHFGHILFEPSCGYPKWVSFLFLPHNIFILFLFTNFYINEYIYKNKKQN
ncbi:Elongation of very long chain fatty acids protein 7 [Papilio xuthus]|uniref:Elongation of very long chain fatty acids protein n=1 Tax=Papilio xuthus TaxID=66420 RepID=A0A194QP32_PAPXU|nr:Elongation of very long chain fatty acids protein 7 [Papilio xuthus]